MCPVCESLERHRLIWLYFTNKTDLFDDRPKRMLHIAPEPQLTHLFQQHGNIDYLSGDLSSSEAMVNLDITDIPFPDNSFDVIYCSHVLEHVPDDRAAMRECRRVLNENGWAILQVPITDDETYEDPSITSPEERERVFGQSDHVRRYGTDYCDRLAECGFSVKVDGFVREMDRRKVKRFGVIGDEEAERAGLIGCEEIYFCRKN